MARRPSSLLAVRYLLIANGVLLGLVGSAYFFFAEKPAGYVVAGVVWLVTAILFVCLPLTNPRRGEHTRW